MLLNRLTRLVARLISLRKNLVITPCSWKFGVTRFCHPVHQVHVWMGFLRMYVFLQSDCTQAQNDRCPFWVNLKAQFKEVERKAASPKAELSKDYKRAFDLINKGDHLYCLVDYKGCRETARVQSKGGGNDIILSIGDLFCVHICSSQFLYETFEKRCKAMDIEFCLPTVEEAEPCLR